MIGAREWKKSQVSYEERADFSEIRFDFKGNKEAGSLRGIKTSNELFFFSFVSWCCQI